MKKLFTFLLFVAAGFALYWFVLRDKSAGRSGPKQAAIVLKKHSDDFNSRIDKVIDAYLLAKDALVNDDSSAAKMNIRSMIAMLDSIPSDELKKDTAGIFETMQITVSDIRSNAQSLLAQTQLTEMRRDFNMVTNLLYPGFFRTINYEGEKLYLQHCPMAFGEDQGASWISRSVEIMNPYLGRNHPEYKSSMLHCGEVKDTIKLR